MFSNLRIGAPLYVLHKDEPRVSIGEVVNVGIPTPQYGTTYTAGYMQPPKMLVDIKIKVGEEMIDLQKLPSDQVIADFGNTKMVVSESKEALLAEVDNMRKSSQSVLDSVGYHQTMIDKLAAISEELNPKAKAEAEQRREIDDMKKQIGNIEDMLTKLLNKS